MENKEVLTHQESKICNTTIKNTIEMALYWYSSQMSNKQVTLSEALEATVSPCVWGCLSSILNLAESAKKVPFEFWEVYKKYVDDALKKKQAELDLSK